MFTVKTTLLFLFICFAPLPLTAQERQEPEGGSIETAITDAIRLTQAADEHTVERTKLQDMADKPKRRLPPSQAARLKELEAELQASLSATRKVIRELRIGESVFSYPGLLALAQVSYNADKRTYSFQLLDGFSNYEGGTTRYPNFFAVMFNESGLITDTRRIRTADMVTK